MQQQKYSKHGDVFEAEFGKVTSVEF